MGYRAYGELKDEKESPLIEFFGGLFIGVIGFPMGYGWILPAWGLLSWPTVWAISGVIGVMLGSSMAWDSIKRKHKKGESNGG